MLKYRLFSVILAVLLGVCAGCKSCPFCNGQASAKSSSSSCSNGSCSSRP